jgi:prefoldin subunit 5
MSKTEEVADVETKGSLIEVEFQKLVEIAEFSNAVELINTKIDEYHARITSLKSGLDRLLEMLPVVAEELEKLDSLERRLLELIIKKLASK